MASEAGERTEAATPRRRQEARAKGQVARSAELNSALILLGTFGVLAFGGAAMGQLLIGALRTGLGHLARPELDAEAVRGLYLSTAWVFGRAILPVALAGAIMGVLASVLQVGFLVTPEAIRPNGARLNPAQGLKNLFSRRGAVELVKAVLKMGILAVVAYQTLRAEWPRFGEVAQMDLRQLLIWQLSLGLKLGLRVGGVYCLVALADFGYQRWQHEKSLRMTRGEVQDEARQTEGSPQIRSRIRSLQQERATRRMLQAVPTATVVVVNPVHIAVALRYEAATMRAPRVVAKGKRLVAERIVAAARAAGVPVVQDVPLARALDKLVEVGGEIPAMLYRAVAAILAYVYAQGPRRPAMGAAR
jgi:flagellar biosynthetic protein FlhB